jgi:superfamily II DNA or RNA helicase
MARSIFSRPVQLAAGAAIISQFEAGCPENLARAPHTGCGKTVVFADLTRGYVARGLRVHVLAHRTELLGQAAAKLRAVGLDPALEQAGSRAGCAPALLCS